MFLSPSLCEYRIACQLFFTLPASLLRNLYGVRTSLPSSLSAMPCFPLSMASIHLLRKSSSDDCPAHSIVLWITNSYLPTFINIIIFKIASCHRMFTTTFCAVEFYIWQYVIEAGYRILELEPVRHTWLFLLPCHQCYVVQKLIHRNHGVIYNTITNWYNLICYKLNFKTM